MSKQKKSKEEPFLISLTPQERYELRFDANYQTGMEYNPQSTPDYNNPYYMFVPKEIELSKYKQLWVLYQTCQVQVKSSELRRLVIEIAIEQGKELTETEFFSVLKQKLT